MKNNRIFCDFFKYVFLNILGQIGYSCYTMADTFFVSADLGTKGLTALNLAFPMFCLMNGIGLMIGMGGGTCYSLARSRRETQRANQIFTNAAYLTFTASALFFFVGVFLSESLVRILGADDTMFALTNTYLKVMLLFAPAFFTNNLLQCFVRNDGNPALSMAAMITGSISNVILDYIFIFPLGMGIFGSIFATGLSPLISIIVLSPYFLKGKNHFHFIRKFSLQRVSNIVSNGIPPLVTEVSSGVVMFLFNFIILRLNGNTGVAAFGIASVISLVVIAIYTGLSQGIQPILSLNHGAGNKENVNTIRTYALTTALLLSVVLYSILFFGADPIALVFNSEKDMLLQALAIPGIRLYFLACPFIGFNLVTATYLISTEHPRPAQIISVSRGILVLIPMAFLLSAIFGLTGVWCSYPLTEASVAIMAFIIYRKTAR